MKIKTPNVAGQFYSADKDELSASIEAFVANTKKDTNYDSRAIIVPHAGHAYSGALAAKGYQYLKKDLETIVIFSPAHRFAVPTFALPTDDAWETPLGNIFIHKDLTERVKNMGGEYCDEAYINEHSIEVQLPFIKQYMPEVNIVPILVGGADFRTLSNIINELWSNEKIGFVISSDLSHFRNKQEALRIDLATADMIENLFADNLMPEQACGYKGISALVDFARSRNFSIMRVGITDSSEKSGDVTSVVGYGSWYVAEQSKSDFIKEHFGTTLINICKVSVKSQLDKINVKIENYPRALETKMGSFVTLTIGGNLRGCIGTVLGIEPLIMNVCKNVRNAAFGDPRFTPVEPNEFDKLTYTISLLSNPVRMNFKDEADLLEQLQPNVDGLIIKDVGRQAVYLPEVWEQIADKKLFLNSLKQKAGLTPEWFSDTFEAYRFTTVTIQS